MVSDRNTASSATKGQTTNSKTTQGQTTQGQMTQGPTTQGQTAQSQTTQGQTTQSQKTIGYIGEKREKRQRGKMEKKIFIYCFRVKTIFRPSAAAIGSSEHKTYHRIMYYFRVRLG